MDLKEYIVSLKRDIDYNSFWNQIENESENDGFVPSRRVDIANNRDASLRQCHYWLTDNEATLLRNDSRVYSVELKTNFEPLPTSVQVGNFNKPSSSEGDFLNWGLRRCIESTNVYGQTPYVEGGYRYVLDGTGVDVVIQDTGLQVDHPEFQDANGVSRVQQIDWYAESGVTGTMDPSHYTDTDGHGTHVAGIVAGKTYGWAKNARIYSVKALGGSATIDPGAGTAFDVIIGWHNNKPVDPVTGVKRPTIVNMSWGYGDYFQNINGGVYRGVPWSGFAKRSDYGMIGAWTGRHGARVSYIDVSIQEMIDAGIHVCIAAGNFSQKIDVPSGVDYDNYYVGGAFNGPYPNYYHRGSSPYDNEAFIVGSIDSVPASAVEEQRATYSEAGPGVDIYAPGTDIVSSTSTGYGANYYLNPNYDQVMMSGTSMASPQVCGVGALFLQMEPSLTPAQLKHKVLTNSTSILATTGFNNDYTVLTSIYNGENRFLLNPFAAAEAYAITGPLTSTASIE